MYLSSVVWKAWLVNNGLENVTGLVSNKGLEQSKCYYRMFFEH